MYCEEKNINELYERLRNVISETLQINYQLIFVDDGSNDNSWALIENLHKNDSNVIGLRFSRNFGHHIAITAGIDYANGNYTLLMDSDLQDQPEEIPKLLDKLKEGYDVVYGVRQKKEFGLIKTVSSNIAITLMNKISHHEFKIDSNIFRILDKKVIAHLKTMRERDRYILGLISYLGFKQIGVPVIHGTRLAGTSKYSTRRLFNLGMNMLTSFSYLPLKIASIIGIIIASSCFFIIGWLLLQKILWGSIITGWTSIMIAIFFMGGVQLSFLGILGEYVGRIYNESRNRPLYILESSLSTKIGGSIIKS